jgi:uncharacterized protein (DUF433 family)
MKYKIPENRHPDIIRDSDICQGSPTLLGTDIAVHTIVNYYQNKGYSPEEILQQFPQLDLPQIHHALAYYYDHKPEIDEELADEDNGKLLKQKQAEQEPEIDPSIVSFTYDSIRQLDERGETIYREKLKPLLEPKYKGKIIAIEVNSGEFFMADSVIQAWQKAKNKYPDKIFYFIKVGFPAVHKRTR